MMMQFAKGKEAEGKLEEAARAYERAQAFESAVSLYLIKLENAPKAFAIVRQSKCKAAAALAARACLQRSNWPAAVEFHVLAGDVEEGWQIAQVHEAVDAFALALPADAPKETRFRIAAYFKDRGWHQKAAEQFRLGGNLKDCISELVAQSKYVRCVTACAPYT
jgi:WD repeat-containing protein 19